MSFISWPLMYERGKVYWNQGSSCAHLLFIDPKLGKTSRQKQNTSRQNQKPHGKTKDLTAKPNTSQQKPNTSRQKQIPTAKPKLFCFWCEVFGFAVRFLVLLWGILFLPWGFWFFREVFCFLPWGFWFCRDVFVFAVRLLVLPWQLWATIVRSDVFLLYR